MVGVIFDLVVFDVHVMYVVRCVIIQASANVVS